MAASSVDLGTIYATIALSMEAFQAQVETAKQALNDLMAATQAVNAPFDTLRGTADTAAESLSALDDAGSAAATALDAVDAAASAGDQALADLGGSAAVASGGLDSVATSATDAGAQIDGASAEIDANSAALDTNSEAADANAVSHKAAGDASEGMGASMGKLVMPATIAAAAVVGLGAVAVHMAGDFQASMTQLVTGAGESEGNLKLVSDGILNLSKATGESTSQLAAGMFMIESSGHHGADGLAVLQAAAQGAAVGGADLGATANALTTILANYGDKGVNAAQATNTLIAIVANGKAHMQDLATSISTVLPAASKYGVSLTDVSAALATMTSQNGDAAASTTYLRQLLTSLSTPSSAAQKALASIGLSAQQVSDELKVSLPDTLQLITDHINATFPPGSQAANDAFKNIAGGARQMQGMLLLTGPSMATFRTDVTKISDTVKGAGGNIQGWSAVQKDFNTQLAQAGATAQVAMIQVGTALEPIVKQIITDVMPALKQFGDWAKTHGPEIARDFAIAASIIGVVLVGAFAGATAAFIATNIAAIGIVGALALVAGGVALVVTHWQQIKDFFNSTSPAALVVKVALVALGGALAGLAVFGITTFLATLPALIAGFVAWAAAAWAAAVPTLLAAAPFIAIGAAIALVALGIYELVTHWSQVKTFLGNIASAVGAFFQTVASFVTTWGEKLLNLYLWPYREAWTLLQAAWKAIVGLVQQGAQDVGGWFSWLGTQIHDKITSLLSLIPALFQAGLRAAEKVVQDAVQTVVGWFVWLFNHNYYFHDLVVGIQREFIFIRDVVTTIWNAITGFLTRAWNGDVALARMLWHALTTGIQLEVTAAQAIISAVWTAISGFVMGVLTTLTGWLKHEWAMITAEAQLAWQLVQTYIIQPVQNAWNRITSIIGGWAGWLRDTWNQIVSDVTAWWGQMTGKVEAGGKAAADKVTSSFITPITSAISGVITQALTWGENLMKMLGQGIANGAGGIKQAASNALGGLGRILGFHSPAAEGPGADADTWAPNLMQMFAAGLAANGPLLAQAAAAALLGVRAALTSGVTGVTGPTFSGGSSGGALASLAPVNVSAGGVLREAITSINSGALAAGSGALAPSSAALAQGSQVGSSGYGDVHIYGLTVEVVAAPSDGEPHAAGVAFGNGFAAGFQQARTQRGL